MAKRKNNELKSEMIRLIEETATIGPMMRGSVTVMGKKNKQPYFSVGIKGKTKVIYLGDKRAKLAREYTATYKRFLDIVEKMTIINMELLKSMKTK
jgi:hypothetical protein